MIQSRFLRVLILWLLLKSAPVKSTFQGSHDLRKEKRVMGERERAHLMTGKAKLLDAKHRENGHLIVHKDDYQGMMGSGLIFEKEKMEKKVKHEIPLGKGEEDKYFDVTHKIESLLRKDYSTYKPIHRPPINNRRPSGL